MTSRSGCSPSIYLGAALALECWQGIPPLSRLMGCRGDANRAVLYTYTNVPAPATSCSQTSGVDL